MNLIFSMAVFISVGEDTFPESKVSLKALWVSRRSHHLGAVAGELVSVQAILVLAEAEGENSIFKFACKVIRGIYSSNPQRVGENYHIFRVTKGGPMVFRA